MDARIRPAPRLLFQLHPARQLPRHRIGCLLAARRFTLFRWFPLAMAAVVVGSLLLRLEVTVATPGNIYFTSGTPEKVVTVESTMLLPVLFVIVATLFATQLSGWAGKWRCFRRSRLHREHRRQPRRRRRRSRSSRGWNCSRRLVRGRVRIRPAAHHQSGTGGVGRSPGPVMDCACHRSARLAASISST